MNLTPELDRFVKEAVARGEFNKAADVRRASATPSSPEASGEDGVLRPATWPLTGRRRAD